MQPAPSDRFWSNVRDALMTRKRALVKRVKGREELSRALNDEGSDLSIMLDAIADGRVTIVPRKD